MTKAELVERVAEAATLSRADAELAVQTVLDAVVDALREGEKIELRGFGSFRLRVRRPRQGRNPKTGTRVDVPGKAIPYFKPGKELRDLLNPGGEGYAGDEDDDDDEALATEDPKAPEAQLGTAELAEPGAPQSPLT